MLGNLFQFNAPFLEFLPWKERGILHGFSSVAFNFKENAWPLGWGDFLKILSVDDLLIDKQVHGVEVVDLREKPLLDKVLARNKETLFGRTGIEADAIIAPNGFSPKKLAIGVTAADCMPVLIKSDLGFLAIHAGWRGLADSVVERSIRALLGDNQDSKLEIVVGPCAGKEEYEVGLEVIKELGSSVQYKELPSGKALLDLAATLEARLRLQKFDFSFYSSGISTISDTRFHSHRREGDKAGRGLGFLVI